MGLGNRSRKMVHSGMCRRWRACYGALVHTRRKEGAMSSAQENKAVSRRVAEEIFNEGNLDLADELYAPDYVLHDPSLRICTGPRP
jgi:hypothetical protein